MQVCHGSLTNGIEQSRVAALQLTGGEGSGEQKRCGDAVEGLEDGLKVSLKPVSVERSLDAKHASLNVH